MDRESRENRDYRVTSLPTLAEGDDSAERTALLLKLYDQVCSNWRELVGVRFKLLGLVPAVSLAVLAAILDAEDGARGPVRWSKLLIGALGLLATLGLFVYDRRNSALHDDLISRGRRIETELCVDTGVFRGRLKARGIIKHDVATSIIYVSSIVAWILGVAFVAWLP